MSQREAEPRFQVPRLTISEKLRGKSDCVVQQRGQKQIVPKEIEDR